MLRILRYYLLLAVVTDKDFTPSLAWKSEAWYVVHLLGKNKKASLSVRSRFVNLLGKKKQEKNNNNLDRDCQSDQDLLICLENNEKIQDCQSDQHLKWGMWESSEG